MKVWKIPKMANAISSAHLPRATGNGYCSTHVIRKPQSDTAINQKIMETCTDYTAFSGKCVSGGIVNAYRALLKAPSFVTMSANSSRSASLNAGRHYWVKFTAPQTGTYTFATTGSLHTVGELYDDNGILVRSSNANSSTSSNFSITEDLAYGDVVYLRISIKGTPASGSFTVHIAT